MSLKGSPGSIPWQDPCFQDPCHPDPRRGLDPWDAFLLDSHPFITGHLMGSCALERYKGL